MGAKLSPTSGLVSMEMHDGRRVVEDKTQERVSHWPYLPVGHEEIYRGQMRERYLALFVSHREVIPAAVVKVADNQ